MWSKGGFGWVGWGSLGRVGVEWYAVLWWVCGGVEWSGGEDGVGMGVECRGVR